MRPLAGSVLLCGLNLRREHAKSWMRNKDHVPLQEQHVDMDIPRNWGPKKDPIDMND